MLHPTLPAVQHYRFMYWVATAGLVLSILVIAGASRVWTEAPVALRSTMQGEAIRLETAASSTADTASTGSAGASNASSASSIRRLYAIEDNGLYLSTNGGADWTQRAAVSAPVLFPASLAVDPGDSLIVYLGTNYNSLFKSVDGGATFLRSSTGLGAGSQVAVTAILAPALHPGLLMATTAYWVGTSQRNLVPQGLYLSTTAGQSWFQVSDALGETAITSLDLDSAMVITAQSADGSIQRIPLDTAFSDLMRYGTAEAKAQVPVAMALLGMDSGETELTRRFWTGEDLPATGAGLALLGTPSAIKTLVTALGFPRESTRWNVARQTLESLGEKAVPALSTAVADNNVMLRRYAVDVLGWIASPSARPALHLALTDEDKTVRIDAAWALAEIR
jgi:hypothetical protein